MAPRIVLLGCGNPSRGDDALGPALLARVRQWLCDRPDLNVRVVEDYQLQVEHALDLAEADLVLFIDADVAAHAPFVLRRATGRRDASFTTHALSPEAVLHVAREVLGREPPPAWVLGVRGEEFALGAPLSTNALGHLEVAWDEVLELLDDARARAWDARAAGW